MQFLYITIAHSVLHAYACSDSTECELGSHRVWMQNYFSVCAKPSHCNKILNDILRSGNEEVHLSKAVRSTVEAEGLEEAEDEVNWKTVDLSKPDLPAGLKELAKEVKVVQEEMAISGVSTFIQRASPPSKVTRVSDKTVLLLHGAAFSSQTWVSVVPTIAILAAAGHNVIAIDLPGFGKTRGR